MKTRSIKKTLLATTAIAAAVSAGSALAAASQNPFGSAQAQTNNQKLAEMSCGANGACGGNMKKDEKTSQKQTPAKARS